MPVIPFCRRFREELIPRNINVLTALLNWLPGDLEGKVGSGMSADEEQNALTRGVLYRFGRAELDERARELRIEGRALALEAKAMEVLLCLLRRPGETLTKDELFDAAWPGRVVTEGTLAKAVMKIRAVLGDDRQTVIRTVHGFGYRLVQPVERLDSDAPALFMPAVGTTVPFRANWRLLESLDNGGRHAVWLAEHVKTRDRRVFKFAQDADALAALKREITLYRLLHDSLGDGAPVVRVHDWNLDEPPYFIESEWLPDGDLVRWSSSEGEADASLPLRLELLAQTADAVAATHALGVVHKDLKPTNVLIRRQSDGTPTACLADFGIGALNDMARIEALGITRLGFTQTRDGSDSSPGTPLYLAPEVLAGQPSTQRSDIYALGVMLYQLTVGDLRRPLAPGWERDIDDELLREDIAATADVDPERRLGDASELARRLRTLDRRRIERDSELALRTQHERQRLKLEQLRLRSRWRAAAMVILSVGLIAASALFLQTRAALTRAEAEAERADRQAAQAEAVSQFLTQDLLAMADPFVSGESELSVRRAMEFARDNIASRFEQQPELEAAVRYRIGRAMRSLGQNDIAEQDMLKAVELSRDSRLRGQVWVSLANQADETDKPAQMLDYGNNALREAAGQLDIQRAARSVLAWHLYKQGQVEQARDALQALLHEIEQDSVSIDSELFFEVIQHLADSYSELGHNDLAEPLLQRIVQRSQDVYGPSHPLTDRRQGQLGRILSRLERHDEAVGLLQQAHGRALELLGAEHSNRQYLLNELATALQNAKRNDEAVPLFADLAELRLRLYGEQHRGTRTAMNNYGLALNVAGRDDESLHWYQRAYEAEVAVLGESHPDTLILASNVGRTLRTLGRLDEAEAMQRRVVDLAEKDLPAGAWQTALYKALLAETLEMRGQHSEALTLAAVALASLESSFGTDHARTRRARAIVDRLSALNR